MLLELLADPSAASGLSSALGGEVSLTGFLPRVAIGFVRKGKERMGVAGRRAWS